MQTKQHTRTYCCVLLLGQLALDYQAIIYHKRLQDAMTGSEDDASATWRLLNT